MKAKAVKADRGRETEAMGREGGEESNGGGGEEEGQDGAREGKAVAGVAKSKIAIKIICKTRQNRKIDPLPKLLPTVLDIAARGSMLQKTAKRKTQGWKIT